MYFKLAASNIKKSYKDYLIYFLTITFGICLFYLFNSMESQKAMLVLDPVKSSALDMMKSALNYVSFFMTVVLAFLMVYANQFLIKRRKQELGIYMTLGMDRIKISYILVLETLLIGMISLVTGLLIGILGSHFLSIITAKMFMVDMREFRFIFSKEAFSKAIINFSIIYGLMIILNIFNISRVRLIELLYARRKSQDLKIKNVYISLALFMVAIISLAYSYYCIQKNGMLGFDTYFNRSIIFGLLGTLLFFMSLSGILLYLFKGHKKTYYKNLNMFSLRQINSKVNTTYVMISVLCILLLIAIGTFSTGMGIVSVVNASQDASLPMALSVSQWMHDESVTLLDKVPELADIGDFDRMIFHSTELTIEEIGDPRAYHGPLKDQLYLTHLIDVIGLSDYNDYALMMGMERLELSDEYILISNMEDFIEIFQQPKTIDFKGAVLSRKALIETSLKNDIMLSTPAVLVVEDGLIRDLEVQMEVYNYKTHDRNPSELMTMLSDIRQERGYFKIDEREDIIASSLGLKTIVAYIAIYVGLVFIMSSVVCLALQQLTEANDNVERYNLLRKLGVETRMIKHSLLVQIAVYFFMPLGLAIIHSYVGIGVASNVVKIFGHLDIMKNMLITSAFALGIYGSYFIITYVAASAIVLKNR